jgi:adenylate cyclase
MPTASNVRSSSPEILGQRRLAAVLVADVVGYSAMMHTDEIGALKTIKAINREIIASTIKKRSGRIVKTTGDGLLAEFSSAVEAVACGVSIQQAVGRRNTETQNQKVQLRIGINVGDIIIEQKDIFGDGVNIAARLESLSPPGGLCLSAAAVDQVKRKLPISFTDEGQQSLKNIDQPVHVFSLSPEALLATPDLPISMGNRHRKYALFGFLAAVVILAGVVSAFELWKNHFAPPGLSRITIAVLPFSNLGSESDNYFSSGLTEDVTSALGRFHELSVISQTALAPYVGQKDAFNEIRRTLNVRYVAEGNIQRTPDRIRIGVNLTDTADGSLLWSEKFDFEPQDIIGIQDRISRQIVGALAIRVTKVRALTVAKLAPTQLEAYDLVLRGRELLNRLTRSDNAEARKYFERARELAPDYAPVYVGLGRVERYAAIQGWSPDPRSSFETTISFARKAISLDDSLSQAYALLALGLVQFARYDEALDALKQAIDLNPSDNEAYSGLLAVQLYRGDIDAALNTGETLKRFQPELTVPDTFHLAVAYLLANRPEEAFKVLQQSLIRNPLEPYTNITLAATLALMNRQKEAEQQAKIILERYPWFQRDEYGSLLRDHQQREKLQAALRQAGL